MGSETPITEDPNGQTPGGAIDASPTWARLQDQIGWYDRKSGHSQTWFKRLKVGQIAIAAAIPVMASIPDAPTWLIGGAGALIVVIEGLQQLMQYQQNWIAYRATCERLKHEQYLFLAGAGPYAAMPASEALLAERIESLVSQEHAAWASNQEEAAQKEAAR